MDEVETAAADTTSEHSSPYHHHHHHHHTSSQGLPPLPPLPGTNYQQEHFMYNEISSEPNPKRPRTSESVGFSDTTSDKLSRHYSLEEQPPGSSVHHATVPGTTVVAVRSQKPVGIAQPIRIQETQSSTQTRQTQDDIDELKRKSVWSSSFGPQSDPLKLSTNPVSLSPEDGTYDSDQSQEKRFNRFTNESKTDLNKEGQLGTVTTVESDLESESVSIFEFPFVPPPPPSDPLEEEFQSINEGAGIKRGVQVRASEGQRDELEGREWESVGDGSIARRRSSAGLLESTQGGACGLPPGKKYHVFVSHSTSDQQWATESILHPLRHTYRMTGVSCCDFMYHSQYNDKEIRNAMKESCVVLIGLSPAYLSSPRCDREWQYAVQLSLSEYDKCEVVVAAVGVCSRPKPLKSFLYLDFMDTSKYKNVWDKLLKTITDTFTSVKPPSPIEESGFSQYSNTMEESSSLPQHQDKQEGPQTATITQEDSPHFQLHQQGSTSDLGGNTSQEDYDGYQKRMAAGFEEMYQEMYQSEGNGNTQSESGVQDAESVKATPWEEASDPRGSRTLDTTEERAESQDVEEVKVREEGSADVEEGEVSDSSGEVPGATEDDQARAQNTEVATFYNKLAGPDADKRNESPIFYMRNFNNWVKSILIRTYLSQLPSGCTVLDLCCGKGGDLLKWKEGGIGYLVCADISEASVKAAESRLHSPKMTIKGKPAFDAEFIVADCCEVRLRDKYQNAARRFNLASCQFSVHYSFESYEKAHMILRNACENLRPGGYFIGTTIDSNQLVHRLRQAGKREDGSWSIGNDVFSVTLDPSLTPYSLPLFGARYNFKLHGVVDLPEFLVHFPLLVSMLKDFDMELKLRQNFYDFFTERRHNTDDVYLMNRMKAFNLHTGTMSTAEWEAVGLYLVYVFQKK